MDGSAGSAEHKLAETIWWAIVLADRLQIDLRSGSDTTMENPRRGLTSAVEGT